MNINFLIILAVLLWSEAGFTSPKSLTYQGRIIKSDGRPLENTSVSFQFEITTPNGGCVLYREQVNGINMANSNGVFDVKIGQSHSYPAAAGFSILDSFNNSSPMTCDGGAIYNPILSDGRLLRVQFHDGTSWKLISPDNIIRSVPYSAYSESSNKLGGHLAADYVLKGEINAGASCNGGSFLTWNALTDSFGCAVPAGGGGGSGTVTEIFSANSYLSVANSTTTPTLTLNVGTSANTVAAGNDARFTNARIPTGSAGGDLGGSYPNPSVARIQGVGIDFSVAPASGQVLTFDGTNWVSQALPAASSGTVTGITAGTGLTGGTINTSGTIGLGAALSGLNAVATNGYIQRTGAGTYSTTTGNIAASNNTLVLRDGSGVSSFYGVGISGATSGAVTLQAPLISGTYSLTLPDAQGAANQVMANDGNGILSWINVPAAPGSACGSGNVLTYNGTAFTCVPDQVGSAGGGIVSLNSQTGSSQSFANGTTGNSPNWSSAADVHTLNIPYARTNSVTAGLISKAEYDIFNGKQNALTYVPLDPANNLNDVNNTATARTNLGLGTAALKDAPASGNASTSEVVMGDDTRLTNSRTPSGSAGGDLGGSYPNPDVNRLKGVGLLMTSLTSGNFLKYNGSNWINSMIAQSDVTGLTAALGSKLDQSQISGTCAANSTLVFSSVSGTWTCTSIGIADSQVTFSSKSANTFLAAPTGGAGAPTFRTISAVDLPSSITDGSWTSSSGNVYRSTGSVGIGTSSPEALLHVQNNTNTGTPSDNVDLIVKSTNRNASFTTDSVGTASGSLIFKAAGVEKGRLSYAVATDDFTIRTNNSDKFRITSTGNVGIGTTSPLNLIDAYSSTDATMLVRAGSVASLPATMRLVGTNSSSTSSQEVKIVAYQPTGGASADTAMDFRVRKNGDTFGSPSTIMSILGTGNVGIGTTTPGERFVIGDHAFAFHDGGSDVLAFSADWNGVGWDRKQSATYQGQISYSPVNGSFHIFSTNADNAAASSFQNKFIAMDGSTGNVGIGTTTPTKKLEVAGVVKATGFEGPITSTSTSVGTGSNTTPSLSFSGDPNTGFYNTSSDDTISVTTGGTNIFNFSSSGLVAPTAGGAAITTANGTASAPTYAFSGDPDTGWFRPAADTMAAATAGVERMRINSTGNVGIGTTNPVGDDPTRKALILADTTNNALFEIWGANSGKSIFQQVNGNTYLGNLAKGSGTGSTFIKYGDGTNGITLLGGNGNVGIGTTSPLGALHVKSGSFNPWGAPLGSVVMGDILANTWRGTGIGMTNSVTGSSLGLIGFNNDKFYFGHQTASNTTSLDVTIDSAGQLGVGTATPGQKLEVNGNIRLSSSGNTIDFGDSTRIISYTALGTMTVQSPGDVNITLDNNNNGTAQKFTITKDDYEPSTATELFRVQENGNVGIMTASPGARLEIQNSVEGYPQSTGTTDTAMGFRLGATSGGSNLSLDMGIKGGAGPGGWLQARNRTDLSLTYPLLLNPNGGNVGIGTTSPSQKLHVTGNVYVASTYTCTIGNASGSVSCSSDERLKENIQPIPEALKKVLNLRGVEFDWNEKSKAHGRHDIGVIAQEVEKEFPSVVHENSETGLKMVDYGSLVAPLIGAVKELYNLWFNDSQDIHRKLASITEENEKLKSENLKKDQELEDIKMRTSEA